jgi:hypothetical protein
MLLFYTGNLFLASQMLYRMVHYKEMLTHQAMETGLSACRPVPPDEGNNFSLFQSTVYVLAL